MNFFSFRYTLDTRLAKEAVIVKLNDLENTDRRFGLYFKYRQGFGRHWLVPKYVVCFRRVPITIEVFLQDKTDGILLTLHFKIANYFKWLFVFALVMFGGLFVSFLMIDAGSIGTVEYLYLLIPLIVLVATWLQFSTQVDNYVKAFKNAWGHL